MSESPRQAVVLLHGIWMTPRMLRYLGKQLGAAGFQVYYFGYSASRQSFASLIEQLDTFAHALSEDTVHFVGHSYGGLVLLSWLHSSGWTRPGRVVTLGTSHLGSGVARRLVRLGLGGLLLGESQIALCQPGVAAPVGRDVGVIAGTLPLGMGKLIGGAPRPSDGAVGLAETRLAGMRDQLVLSVSHSGMLFSRRVADAVVHFLTHGDFASLK